MSNTINRGTTARPDFSLPFLTSAIHDMEVYFAQGDRLIIEKKMADCELSDSTVIVPLTEEDTLKLDDKLNLYIQFRFVFDDAYTDMKTSNIITTTVYKILKEGPFDVD